MRKLFFVLYVSQASISFTKKEMDEMVKKCSENNQQNNVTGYLYYENGYFFQYLEAYELNTLSSLLNTLSNDNRHRVLQTFIASNRVERRFKDWFMKRVDELCFINFEAETNIIEYMKWLSNDNEIKKLKSNNIWNLVDALTASKNKANF